MTDLLDEIAEKIEATERLDLGPEALQVSDDVWLRLCADANAMHLFAPSAGVCETVLGLPVEHVEGRNVLIVRTRARQDSNLQPSD